MKLKEIPQTLRPREKAWSQGIKTLNDAELLAIILRTGSTSDSALELAYQILAKFDGLYGLTRADSSELCQLKGISKIKSLEIMTFIELAKRISDTPRLRQKIQSPQDIYKLLGEQLKNASTEEFYLVLLDNKNCLIAYVLVSKGNKNAAILHPRDILKEAIRYDASSIILVHNHPSGDPTPSKSDVETTQLMAQAAKLMGIPIVEHVILGFDCLFSFKAGELL